VGVGSSICNGLKQLGGAYLTYRL